MAQATEMTCALWYWEHGTINFILHRTEEGAAQSAIWMSDDGECSPIGVQFADGRTLRMDEWPAYHAADEEATQLAIQRVNERTAKSPPPLRTIRDPFEGKTLAIDASEPIWVGNPADG